MLGFHFSIPNHDAQSWIGQAKVQSDVDIVLMPEQLLQRTSTARPERGHARYRAEPLYCAQFKYGLIHILAQAKIICADKHACLCALSVAFVKVILFAKAGVAFMFIRGQWPGSGEQHALPCGNGALGRRGIQNSRAHLREWPGLSARKELPQFYHADGVVLLLGEKRRDQRLGHIEIHVGPGKDCETKTRATGQVAGPTRSCGGGNRFGVRNCAVAPPRHPNSRPEHFRDRSERISQMSAPAARRSGTFLARRILRLSLPSAILRHGVESLSVEDNDAASKIQTHRPGSAPQCS